MERRGKPVKVVQIGTISVPVYAAPSRKNGHSYSGFRADLRQFNQGRPFSSSLEGLETRVKELVGPLIGEHETLTLRHGALRTYDRAVRIAGELGLELDEAMLRLREIGRLTASKECSVEQAVNYWAQHHDQSKFGTPTSRVVEAFLVHLEENGNSKEDIQGVKGKLKRFAGAFECSLNEITREQYRVYFRGIQGSRRHKMNHRNEVRRFVNWAKDNDYMPLAHPGVPRSAGKVKSGRGPTEVYSIAQREQLIEQARPYELPMTLVKAYCPIRQKESGLSCWENLDWDVRVLMVWGDEAKKRVPRPIHLPRELCERLRPLARPSGRIYPYKSFYKVGPRLARKAGLKWIRNGWRTTTISHLQAAVNDIARVAEEAGTSVNRVNCNYLRILRPDVGRAYFGLRVGEFHPIEPGYNAAHYGSSLAATSLTPVETENVIHVKFGVR